MIITHYDLRPSIVRHFYHSSALGKSASHSLGGFKMGKLFVGPYH
jgi:hypothetical protein